MPKGLVDFLQRFDLDNYNLSGFFAEVAIDLDNLSKGQNLNKIDYKRINCASKILRNKSREFRLGKEDLFGDDLFFWQFYGKKKEESNINFARGLYADRLLILGEELSIIRNLSGEKLKELANTCVEISKKVREYWGQANPEGFKKY